MRKPIVAGNWKMHKTVAEATRFAEEVKHAIPSSNVVEAVVCAPAIALSRLVETVDGSDLNIGAQNMHWEEQGAYTGEISPYQLKELGAHYVIIGHSERRAMFAETDEIVNKKVHAAYQFGLVPIICVGETDHEREAGETEVVVREAVERAVKGISQDDMTQAVIAYEPIWAIGTGKSATASDANIVCGMIRQVLSEQYSEEIADHVRIQYGGSVDGENISTLLAEPHIDGALVGGASLDPTSFLNLLKAVQHD